MDFEDNDNHRTFFNKKFKASSSPNQNDFEGSFNLATNAKRLFNKKISLTCESEWKLPEKSELFVHERWSVRELQTIKSGLNFHKSQLNDYSIEHWSLHTRRRNPAGGVKWKVRTEINPEFLTQAWTKFYECAFTYNVVPACATKHFASLHLCEAPGAFIAALNHYLKQNHPVLEWKWLASTLNPYYEGNSLSNMIIDDRFMLHTLDSWYFGNDNTGNLMNWENSQSLIQKSKNMGKVLLVTADGSIDCLSNPGEQEEIVAPLHYCEVITALQALSDGGSMIHKFFTTFEDSTINLLYLMTVLFDKVNIFKPGTSKEGNSEVYAVCLGFHGSVTVNNYKEAFKIGFGTKVFEEKSLFPQEAISKGFLTQIRRCACYFSVIQNDVIDKNVLTYERNWHEDHQNAQKLKMVVSNEFISRYDLRSLPYDEEILKGLLHEENRAVINPRYQQGSYTERTFYEEMSLKQKLNTLDTNIKLILSTHNTLFEHSPVKWLEIYDENCILEYKYVLGKPLQAVRSTQFGFSHIFKFYLKLNEVSDETKIVLQNDCECKPLDDFEDVEILCLSTFLSSEKYDEIEKNNFKRLYEKMKSLSSNDTLIVRNFNLLTHFNVGVLYILCKKIFRKIGFTDGRGLILSQYVGEKSLLWLQNVIREIDSTAILANPTSVLMIFPVSVTNMGDFFMEILQYNNVLLKYISESSLNELKIKVKNIL